ncbi:MAG: hypothetical protein WB992_19100 [Bryobacteraceae bacterium]
MAIIGDSERWAVALLDAHGTVAAVIESIWPLCRTSLKARRTENYITRRLVRWIRRDDRIRDSFLQVESQRELLEDDPDPDCGPQGYLDIAILFWVGRDNLCLAIECKRLNVLDKDGQRDSLANEYVRKGMLRFVTGQYAPDLPVGGMIGYVMDGDMPFAFSAVKGKIQADATLLACDLSRSRDLVPPHSFVTAHSRSSVPVELRHLLLSVLS